MIPFWRTGYHRHAFLLSGITTVSLRFSWYQAYLMFPLICSTLKQVQVAQPSHISWRYRSSPSASENSNSWLCLKKKVRAEEGAGPRLLIERAQSAEGASDELWPVSGNSVSGVGLLGPRATHCSRRTVWWQITLSQQPPPKKVLQQWSKLCGTYPTPPVILSTTEASVLG